MDFVGDDGAENGMVKYIWGTTISLHESMNDFRSFLRGFKIKYRSTYNSNVAKALLEAGDIAPPPMPLYDGLTAAQGEGTLYERYLKQLRETGQTNLNLDAINLLAYPPTKKLYHQLINYPQEVIPIMDQVLRDVMIESAEEELEKVQTRFAEGAVNELEVSVIEEEVRDIEGRVFKVRPYGGEKTVNMRDLNPGGQSALIRLCRTDLFPDTDKLVSVKGLVIRATPIIPDMTTGESTSSNCWSPLMNAQRSSDA